MERRRVEHQGTLVVDTSIQVWKIFGPDEVRDRIMGRLASANAETVPYVRMEFIRGQLAPMAEALSVAENVRMAGGNLAEWQARLAHVGHGRDHQKRMQFVSYACRCRHPTLVRAIRRLEYLLDGGWEEEFGHAVRTRAEDPLECRWTSPPVTPTGLPRISCTMAHPACKASSFVAGHVGRLQMLVGLPDLDPKIAKAADRVTARPAATCGQQACWALGDVIIALQVPSGSALYSADKALRVICETLDVAVEIEPP